ncbi:hypothetical protein [Burkholderia lata]|uniref:hypothetical protein n=1 Tax=Burkholderia lata (strain ATCC 17760 / DSM 23089 / LMG 22485 / NCIMB 9086 / R18194 / 383) TaxID=482957 RepID=UPI001581D3CA|nr:hypothetical protein [Burkholderia lata]
MSENKACRGAATLECRMSDMGHGQQCRNCGVSPEEARMRREAAKYHARLTGKNST